MKINGKQLPLGARYFQKNIKEPASVSNSFDPNQAKADCKCHQHLTKDIYSKTCVKRQLSKRPKLVFKTYYHLLQVKSSAECCKREHSAILSTCIKLPFVIKIFVLSIFEWPSYTGFTVLAIVGKEFNMHEQPSSKTEHICHLYGKYGAISNSHALWLIGGESSCYPSS